MIAQNSFWICYGIWQYSALEPLTKISSNLINYATELADMISDIIACIGRDGCWSNGNTRETVEDYFNAWVVSLSTHVMDGKPEGHLAFVMGYFSGSLCK